MTTDTTQSRTQRPEAWHSWFTIGWSVVAGLIAVAAVYELMPGRPADEVNPLPIVRAAHRYAEARKLRGEPVPATVDLGELVQGGFLSARDAEGFQDAQVSLRTNLDAVPPQEMLVKVHIKGGPEMWLLADGSVQTVKR